MPEMEVIAGLLVGVGLSAACGLRLFIPPLIMSIASLYFHVPLPEQLNWLGTQNAFFILLAATLVEVGAYYVPWLDHMLDTIATPLAVVAGTLITSSFGHDLDPAWRWSIALIAGGTAAGAMQSISTLSRLASLGLTGGLANPIIATIENFMSVFMAVAVIAFPLLTLGVLALIIWGSLRVFGRAKQT